MDEWVVMGEVIRPPPQYYNCLLEARRSPFVLQLLLFVKALEFKLELQITSDIMAGTSFMLQSLVVFLTAFLTVVSGWDISDENDRHGCQTYSRNPLDGCDYHRTLFVDCVSPDSQYKTVQSGKIDQQAPENYY